MSLDSIAKSIQHVTASIHLSTVDKTWLILLFVIVVVVVAGYTLGRFKTAIALLVIYGLGFVAHYLSLPQSIQRYMTNKNVQLGWTILPLIALALLFLEKRKKRARPSPRIPR